MVTFRGSVTFTDWLVNGNAFIDLLPNPLKQQTASSLSIPQGNWIGMHSGFHSYLFGAKSKSDPTCKYDLILDRLRLLLETFPDFSVVLTGHSLGGALATLCCFRLALDLDLKKPVKCITFASPRTCNISFARAFQELEVQQKIVCLRVANKRDVITKHPDRLSLCTFFCQNAIFRHVGLELVLYSVARKSTHRLRYHRVRRSGLRQLSDDFARSAFNTATHLVACTCGCCVEDYLKWHSCEEYMSRMERAAANLQGFSMVDACTNYHGVVSEASEPFTLTPLRHIMKRRKKKLAEVHEPGSDL